MNSKTSILFVDDDVNLLAGLRRSLRKRRGEWQTFFAHDGADALSVISTNPIDVIVSDMKMPELDGAELLTKIAKSNPQVVRLMLSGQAEHLKILKGVAVAHQFLSKPCDTELLQSTIQQIVDSQSRVPNCELKGVISQLGSVPCLPEHFVEMGAALAAGIGEFDRVKAIVASDPGLSVKVMQLVSSSYFGTPQPACGLDAACEMLGCELLSQLFTDTDVFQPLVLDAFTEIPLARHYVESRKISKLAERIARTRDCSSEEVSVSKQAGLFHNIGRIILMHFFPAPYSKVLTAAVQNELALEDAEEAVFGTQQNAISAFLMALWGINREVVNVVSRLYEEPDPNLEKFGPATALFAARQLVNGASASLEESEHIRKIGCTDQIPIWRSMLVGVDQ